MYQHLDTDHRLFTLHDCKANNIRLEGENLIFSFPKGFWVLSKHPDALESPLMASGPSELCLHLTDDWVVVNAFRSRRLSRRLVGMCWELKDLMEAVNSGKWELEFHTEFHSHHSPVTLYQCCLWHRQCRRSYILCDLEIDADRAEYRWNALDPERVW